MIGPKLIFISILFIFSCQQETNIISKSERQIIVQTIKSTLEDYNDAIKAEGLEAEFKYLDSSADFFWIPPGYQHPLTYDSVFKILKQNAIKLKSIENTFDSLKIFPLTKEIATYTAQIHSIVTDTAHNTTQTKLIESGILVKRKNRWKLLSGHTSVLADQ